MKRKSIQTFILLAASLMTSAAASFGSSSKDEKVLVFEKFVKPWITNSTYLNVNGYLTIDCGFLFDDSGFVEDWIPIRTNDVDVIQSIDQVVKDWKIQPPVVNGIPSWSYVEFQIRFVNEGAVVSLTPLEAVLSFTKTMRDDFQLVVPFSELDSIPRPIKMDAPKLSPALVHANSGQIVRFEFFIDQEGKVRIPIIKEKIDTEAMAATIMLESLLKWEFEPPHKNGKAVLTRAVIPFRIP